MVLLIDGFSSESVNLSDFIVSTLPHYIGNNYPTHYLSPLLNIILDLYMLLLVFNHDIEKNTFQNLFKCQIVKTITENTFFSFRPYKSVQRASIYGRDR